MNTIADGVARSEPARASSVSPPATASVTALSTTSVTLSMKRSGLRRSAMWPCADGSRDRWASTSVPSTTPPTNATESQKT